ncbi:general stress protein [Aeromicrobium alkaliterrae]|uniref:General stress protein 17M-like domain-containing protein n=1 Tax=Aeromicrobium alkaliterrae TaxID=302168 RepID=A0ABN2JID5_9ACTN
MPQIFSLEFPQSLATFDDYDAAQKAVDALSDAEFPVQNLLIVGTDLKQVERVTGRLTTGRVALAGALSGLWFGVFMGLLIGLFASETHWLQIVATGAGVGAGFGAVWALMGYAATRGRRDFSSVKTVVATRYEVLVEHRHLAQAQELLGPVGRPNPFA